MTKTVNNIIVTVIAVVLEVVIIELCFMGITLAVPINNSGLLNFETLNRFFLLVISMSSIPISLVTTVILIFKYALKD